MMEKFIADKPELWFEDIGECEIYIISTFTQMLFYTYL